MEKYTKIRPGKIWLDTDGKRIQAHGGSILTVGDTFYWYGENKEKTTGQTRIWHWGVRCYSSKDLMNWKNEGIIIPPEPDDPKSPLYPEKFMDRPHILYNKKTKKYVAWLKLMGDEQQPAHFAVLTADRITGPYMMENPVVNPYGHEVGDFDLAVDEENGHGYLISQLPHTCIYIADLNDSYTDVAENGGYSEHFHHDRPPVSREAPAHFYRHGKHYLITSGTTGYFPNPSEIAMADGWHGPYGHIRNAHPKDTSGLSYNSQISSVFRYPFRKDLYIALGDRWRPDVPSLAGDGLKNGDYSRRLQEKFRKFFDPNAHFELTPDVEKDMMINSSVADYVWLPILFDGDEARIEWRDEWSPDDEEFR